MTDITLTASAAAIVKADISAFKRDGKRYASYVAEMGVTADTVAEHVAIFREAFKAATPKADGAKVKAYATKVRNGLNYHVTKDETTKDSTDYLLTRSGLAVLTACESTDDMVELILAELAKRSE